MQGQRKSGPRAAVRVGQGTSLPDGLETWLRRTNYPFPLRSQYLPINKARPGALLAKGRPQIFSPPGEAAVLGLCIPGASTQTTPERNTAVEKGSENADCCVPGDQKGPGLCRCPSPRLTMHPESHRDQPSASVLLPLVQVSTAHQGILRWLKCCTPSSTQSPLPVMHTRTG